MVFEREVSEQLFDELQHRGEPYLAVFAFDSCEQTLQSAVLLSEQGRRLHRTGTSDQR
jgi:hypothetical protein